MYLALMQCIYKPMSDLYCYLRLQRLYRRKGLIAKLNYDMLAKQIRIEAHYKSPGKAKALSTRLEISWVRQAPKFAKQF